MLFQILAKTPRWVWGQLLALLWLSLSQTASRTTSLRHVTLLPLAMTGLPLLLPMGIFMTKYLVGAVSAMQPALAHDTGFSLAFAALYGAFAGVFLARAGRLWRLALQIDRRPGTIVRA